ncbi:MAG: hypothetical protein ABJB66_13070, partial [Gemmatimonadaceae bacterium]
MSRSIPLSGLSDWLRTEVSAARPGEVAILAGHYAIFTSGADAVDLLDERELPVNAPRELLDFTRFSWAAACAALAGVPERRARLVVLVDDLQFVRPDLPDRSTRERLATELVGRYLARVNALPEYHTRVLRAHGLNENAVLTHSENRSLFSERELRLELVRHLKDEIDAGSAGAKGLHSNEDRSTISVTDPEYGDYCIVQSGHTNCAGGYVELLAQLSARGVRTLIALVPMRCIGPITMGTALVSRLGGADGVSVINVAIADVKSD